MKEPLTPAEARKLLSSILAAGGRVSESKHFRERLAERRMTMLHAQAIMQRGAIWEPAELEHGSYRYRFHLKSVGSLVVAFVSETEATLVSIWRA